MPEISSIPYETAEDLNKFLYDNYYSTENQETLETGTGAVTSRILELDLSTGVTEGSIAMANYNFNYFNPLYAEAVWKCYMNSKDDVFMFFGFKETLAEPTHDMVESHAGFMVYLGELYATVADGTTQQKVKITGIDVTRVENYKIEYNRFSVMPLPLVEEQLSLPGILSTFPTIIREWKLLTTLSNYPPENKVHHIVQYVKNTVGATKYIRFNRFIYKEVYAD